MATTIRPRAYVGTIVGSSAVIVAAFAGISIPLGTRNPDLLWLLPPAYVAVLIAMFPMRNAVLRSRLRLDYDAAGIVFRSWRRTVRVEAADVANVTIDTVTVPLRRRQRVLTVEDTTGYPVILVDLRDWPAGAFDGLVDAFGPRHHERDSYNQA